MAKVFVRYKIAVASSFLFIMLCTSLLAFRRSTVSVRTIYQQLPSLMSTRLSSSFPGVNPSSSSRVTPEENANKLRELFIDLRGILSTPGLASTSLKRSLQIASGLAKVFKQYSDDKSFFLDAKGSLSVPRVLRRVFEELGATYVKLGQFIASSPTLFPADYVEEFQACLDSTPTVPYETIRRIIQADLKRPIISVFSSIDPIPVASASIAQVHRGRLKNGMDVAIKVRKPGVDSTLQADLAFLLVATKLLEFINPSLSNFSLANIIADIRDSMLDELDFRKEADNLINFRQFLDFNGIDDATAPEPFLDVSGEKVLVMEFLDGVPLVDLEGIKKFTSQPEATLLSALRTWATSVAVNERFHGDIHAGNLLGKRFICEDCSLDYCLLLFTVLKNGRIGFIDFGIGKWNYFLYCFCVHIVIAMVFVVGKISDKFRNAVGSLFNAFVVDDYQGVAAALVDMGATKGAVDKVKFGNELKEVIVSITQLQPDVMVTTNAGKS